MTDNPQKKEAKEEQLLTFLKETRDGKYVKVDLNTVQKKYIRVEAKGLEPQEPYYYHSVR